MFCTTSETEGEVGAVNMFQPPAIHYRPFQSGSFVVVLCCLFWLLNVFGVGVSCRKLYYFVVYLYVNGSGSITSVGEERANLSAVIYL